MKKIISPIDPFSQKYSGRYVNLSTEFLRLTDNITLIPEDMFQLLQIKLVGQLKHRSKWRQLGRIEEMDIFKYDTYFKQHGKENDREAVYGFFTMTDKYIFVPPQLKAKAIVIYYVSTKSLTEYNQSIYN